MPFCLYNTATRRVEPFVPRDPRRVTFYTCGPTVYDDAHIGNFRAFLAADVLRRWIESPLCTIADSRGSEHAGPREVVHVMNITDVGHMTDDDAADGGGQDKMELAGQRIAEAKKSGKLPPDADVDPTDPYAIAEFYMQRFMEDARRLGLKVAREAQRDKTLMPRACENIEGMQRLIAALIERGHAYIAGPVGSRAVYFDVQSFPAYGSLSGNTLDSLRGGAGGRVSEEHQQLKKHPADFLLWKEDSSHLMKWDSPWGVGYPGWHIECSVMSLGRLVPGGIDRVLARPDPDLAIDLHSGGEDNIFPHHECEQAQSCSVLGGSRFARHWFHTRFLMVDGQKMSKSRGTFYTARQLFGMGHEPAAVRLELIKAHYRSNADFSMQGLKDSARMVERWRRFVDQGSQGKQGAANTVEDVRAAFVTALMNDLNMAEAIGAVNRWINEVSEPTQADAAVFREFDAIFGLLDLPRLEAKSHGRAIYLPGVSPNVEVSRLLDERAEARSSRDFAKADAIRDQLRAMGYAIKDVAGGKVEVGPA
ncbi:MAG: cysteine--tRNA ligase [Planctomycetota bacterium]|nr:MAG: cysteine--tRNA ligase [Planctomycetota bacterium]